MVCKVRKDLILVFEEDLNIMDFMKCPAQNILNKKLQPSIFSFCSIHVQNIKTKGKTDY